MARQTAGISRREALMMSLAVSFTAPAIAIAASTPDTPLHLMKPALLPPFQFFNAKQQPVSLAQFRGRFVLLNIWASWYVPCRRDMASLDRLQARLGGPRFQVVPVSIDTGGLAPVIKFYSRKDIRHLGIYLDQSGSAMTLFNLQDIPAAFLIDPQGRLIGVKPGVAAWDSPDMLAFLTQTISGHAGATKRGGQ